MVVVAAVVIVVVVILVVVVVIVVVNSSALFSFSDNLTDKLLTQSLIVKCAGATNIPQIL